MNWREEFNNNKKDISLVDLAETIVERYTQDESEYIKLRKFEWLVYYLMKWYQENAFNPHKQLNMKRLLLQIDKDLLPIKQNLYLRWCRGQFKIKVKELKQKIKLTSREEYLYDLVSQFKSYNVADDNEIKRELGLNAQIRRV